MNPIWSKFQEESLELSLPSKIAEFTFLSPNQYRIEKYMGKEIMVVAEDRWITPSGEYGVCLVITLSGQVYVADLLTYKPSEYCSESFITVLGPITATVLTGAFVIENIFGIPGLGKFFVSSVQSQDYPMIAGTTIFYGAFLIIANLIVDIVYCLVDPRVKLGKE